MSSEIFHGRVLAVYESTAKMGGDLPNMVKHEPPLVAHLLAESISRDAHAGRIPPGKRWGIAIGGPMTRPDGKKATLVFKVEYDQSDFRKS